MTVGAGDLLGISPVLGQTRMTATARTVAPTQALQLNVGQILTLCEHNPRFGYEFMRRAALAVAKRLNATRLQLIDVFGAQMPDVAGVRRDEG
jgi:CRP-like cAMP-binding protein